MITLDISKMPKDTEKMKLIQNIIKEYDINPSLVSLKIISVDAMIKEFYKIIISDYKLPISDFTRLENINYIDYLNLDVKMQSGFLFSVKIKFVTFDVNEDDGFQILLKYS